MGQWNESDQRISDPTKSMAAQVNAHGVGMGEWEGWIVAVTLIPRFLPHKAEINPHQVL